MSARPGPAIVGQLPPARQSPFVAQDFNVAVRERALMGALDSDLYPEFLAKNDRRRYVPHHDVRGEA